MHKTVLTCLLLMPVPSWSCPTAADLDTGIRFEVATGEWEIFRRVSDSVIEATYYYDADAGTQVMLAKGVYLLSIIEEESGALVPSTRQGYTYPLQPKDMPDPVDGNGWNVEATILSQDGLIEELQSYVFGSERQQGYGACFYKMIPITFRYRLEGEDSFDTDTLHYLPELGLSYLAASQGSDYEESYDYIAIEALK